MAVYHCYQCDTWLDNDYHPCDQHPKHENELICPECLIELEDTPEVRQKGEFTTDQLAIIKKLEAEYDNDSEEE